MSSKSPKSPLRPVEPEPERNPSPAPRDPSPSNSYAPYHPAGYTPEPYNPQNFPPPAGSESQNLPPSSPSGRPASGPTLSGPLLSHPPPSTRPLSTPPGPDPLSSGPPVSGSQLPGPPSGPPPGPPGSAPSPRLSPRPATPGMPLRSSSEPQIQDRPAPMATDVQQKPASFGPMVTTTTTTTAEERDLKSLKTNCQFSLREYLSLQRERGRYDAAVSATTADLETRIRSQGDILLGELKILQGEVRSLAKKAENHRWRRWIIGGAIASFIPIIRRFWRRGDDQESEESSNDTEYAFRKSQGLLEHIKNSLLGKGHFAQIAFMVFAVLYVFSNEVSLRVARTTQKRIKKLCARIERGDPDIGDHDMKLLEGWRWRILLW